MPIALVGRRIFTKVLLQVAPWKCLGLEVAYFILFFQKMAKLFSCFFSFSENKLPSCGISPPKTKKDKKGKKSIFACNG
jgi:hypothetical protein